jgi:hypothetical protein
MIALEETEVAATGAATPNLQNMLLEYSPNEAEDSPVMVTMVPPFDEPSEGQMVIPATP